MLDFIASAGAVADPVLPYIYASAADDRRVVDLIDRVAAGGVDIVAFTSAPQVRRLFAVAEAYDMLPKLRQGLARGRVAAVGPVVASELTEHDVRVDIAPAGRFFMKPLVTAIADAFKR